MTPDPVPTDARTEGDFNVSQVWLDALSRGACDEDAFLRAVQMLTRRSPEAAWESLALLDQYFRRGKIGPDVFKRVKSRLGSHLLGPALDVELSVPLKRQETPPPPSAVAVPAPPPPAPPAPAMKATSPPPPPASKSAATTPASAPVSLAATPTPPLATPLPVPNSEAATSPPMFLVTPRSGSKSSDGAPSAPIAGISGGRTVPIGVESTQGASISPTPTPPIPVLNPPDQTAGSGRGDSREVTVGDVLRSRYVIKNVLGLGGTGTVFEAIDRFRLDLPESGQRVAIKVLHSATSGQSAVLTDLRREFQLLQSLSHPNIVRAHEYDRDGDTAFFTMEHLSGLSLESVLSAHREVVLSRAHALIIVRDVAAALEHAHSRGVVHGDLNPGNIFITNDGGIRVLDFGAAHTPTGTPTVDEPAFDGTAFATPRYASVQLLDGERADPRDDTYSLACILYVLLAGKHPFGELNAAQARAQRVKPRRPAGLTGKQWAALRTGLSFDRQRRPLDVAAWLEPFDPPKPEVRLPVLLALLKSSPRATGRHGGIALLVAAFVIVAIGWWATGHRELVAQATGDTGSNIVAALGNAQSSLADLWQRARSAASGSSSAPSLAPVPDQDAMQPPPTAAPAPPPTASPSVDPSGGTARSVRPRVQESISPAPAARTPPMRAAVSAAPAPAALAPAALAPAAQDRAANTSSAHTKIELTADTVEVPYSDPAAHVLVKRTGNLHDDTSFTWWTESGTAKPGQDFAMVKPHEEHFEDGKPLINLFVPVIADSTRKQPRSFYIVINDPSEHAALGKRTLTMVTIVPAETVSEASAQ